MRRISIAVAALCLIMFGCDDSETRHSNAGSSDTRKTSGEEYLSNLLIHVQPTSASAFNGVVEPKFTLTITNTGGKTVRRIRIVGEVSLGNAYHDTSVKVLNDRIEKDGGKLKVDFAFSKSNKMSDAQILMNQIKYRFTVKEIGF